jgi:RHS repeat-associated protein
MRDSLLLSLKPLAVISRWISESGTVTYDYDANGNLITKVDANSITTSFAYDAINRVTSRSYLNSPGTPAISYFYDAQPLPSGAPTFDRGYSTGRLVAVTYGSGSSAGTYRGYDQMGRVVRQYQRTDSVNYLVEVVTYTNDAAGRLSALSSTATSYGPGASVSSIQYAAHNSLKTETYGNGLIHAVNYNERLQATEIKLGTSGNPTSIVALAYGYGTTSNNGNVLTHTYNGGGLSYTQTFGYDSLNRLTTSSESGSSWSQTNAYDRYGNRWIDLGGGTQSLYFNTANNRITGGSYDAAGNLLNDGSHSYSYDAENKLTNVDSVAAYIYDGEGQRVRKLVGENLRFVYSIGGQVLAEFSGAGGTLLKEYIYGAQGLLATIEPTAVNPNGTRYTTPDNLGSPRVVTNSTAGLVSRHDYMPFGGELSAGVGGRTTAMGFPGSSDGLRQKFTAKERDVETGLDYFIERYYSSIQGRFNSPDPEGPNLTNPQTLNRYRYGLNNPLRYVDKDGRYEEDVHYDLTKALAYAAGFSLRQSEIIAQQNQRIDTELDPIGPLGTNFSNRECCHFTDSRQREKLWTEFEDDAGYYENWKRTELTPHPKEGIVLYYLGKYEHALQDSFSHQGYGFLLGQSVDLFKFKDPTLADKTDTNPEKADKMAYATFVSLVKARNLMNGRFSSMARPISYGAIKGLIHQWNIASDMAKKRSLMEQIMRKVGAGRSIQENDSVPYLRMRTDSCVR